MFKIMPGPIIGTIFNDKDNYIKVVKLCLKQDKRLPQHSQQGYNAFIVPTAGTLIANINSSEEVILSPGDLLAIANGDSFSLLGQCSENPFLYFIVPQIQLTETHVVTKSRKGILYSDSSIEFIKHSLTNSNTSIELSNARGEIIALCCDHEVSVSSLEPDKKFQLKLMVSDLVHCHGNPGVKFMFKDNDSLVLVANLFIKNHEKIQEEWNI